MVFGVLASGFGLGRCLFFGKLFPFAFGFGAGSFGAASDMSDSFKSARGGIAMPLPAL